MSRSPAHEKPLGVYLIALYFLLAGFLESIERFRAWGSTLIWNPLAEHSLWHLVANILMYMAVAYLIWQLTWVGRLAGLVYGYLTLATYTGALVLYLQDRPLNVTPLFTLVALYHVLAIGPMLFYLQPAMRKQLFHVSLLEILLPRD